MIRNSILVLSCLGLLIACQPSAPQDIASLEKAVASHPNDENVTALLTLYQDSVAKLASANPAWRSMQEKILAVSTTQNRHEAALMSAKELAMHAPDESTKQGYVQQLRGILDNLGKDTYIKPLGSKVFNDSIGEINTEAAAEYIAACEAYALVYKGSDAASDYLYKASETARAMRSPEKCLEIYDWLIRDYPNSKRGIQALFLKGFTYDNDLHQIDKAKAVYEEFLEKYPDDEFAGSAEFLLENLGKSDDELLEALQKKGGEKK
jgi:TolA-binding protein